jgi:transposase InsO family protein
MVILAVAELPGNPYNQVVRSTVKRLLIGRPLDTREEAGERIPKRIALATFSSGATSGWSWCCAVRLHRHRGGAGRHRDDWLYLASVLDLASRHLLGWSMGPHHDARLVTRALDAAVATRGRARMPATIFHPDRVLSTPPPPASRPTSGGAAALHEPHRLVSRQRRRRELVRLFEGRTGRPPPLPNPRGGPRRDLLLDRLVQPIPTPLHPWYLPPIEWEQQHAAISPLPSTTAA